MRSFDPQIILREELGELKAYSPSPGNYEIRLDANEAPDLLSPELKRRFSEIAAKSAWQKYPDAGQKALRKAIAKKAGVSASQVVAGVGSDEIITMLLTAATRLKSRAPAPTLVTTTPTFVMYRLSARMRGQRVMEVPLDDAWDIDADAVIRAAEMAAPNLIFIASPNNPTGTMVSADRLERIVEACPDTLVVIDEAYVDYADRNQMALLNKYENVAILRTLSKIGFAALRVGWMIGSASLVTEVDKVRLPYNVPTLSQDLAACALNEFDEELTNLCKTVCKERQRVASALEQSGRVEVVPSQANFLWLKLPVPAGEVFTALCKKSVLVRSFHGRGGRLERCLRVTIGTPSQNDRFLDALSESL